MNSYDKASDLLARRSHFRAELANKLRQRGYGEDEIESALDRLTEHGYLDDERTAREFARSRLARGPIGRRRLRAELQRRGVPDAAVEAGLEELPDDEAAAVREAAERYLTRSGKRNRAALGRHLERKGFARHAIFAILDQFADEIESPS